MNAKTTLSLLLVLLFFPFGEASAADAGRCKAQPNELAVDICVYMRLTLPEPEKPREAPALGPSLFSKIRGIWGNGNVGEWITENPPRVETVTATPPYAGQTPRYGLVVLWSFGEPPRRIPYELVGNAERERILERSLAME